MSQSDSECRDISGMVGALKTKPWGGGSSISSRLLGFFPVLPALNRLIQRAATVLCVKAVAVFSLLESKHRKDKNRITFSVGGF
jgi:hypothetical protein